MNDIHSHFGDDSNRLFRKTATEKVMDSVQYGQFFAALHKLRKDNCEESVLLYIESHVYTLDIHVQ